MKNVIISCILLYSASIFAQTNLINISGKIIDSSTSQVLPSASISILAKSIGTTSNSSGYFKFLIPIESENDTMQISMLGYEAYKEVVRKLKNINEFKLIPKIYSIDEVNIKAYTAKEIVKKAFKNVNKNYHQQPALYNIFYRQFWKKDSIYVWALEADEDMYYKGFQYSFAGLQFKTNNIRKRKSNFDGVVIHELDAISEYFTRTFRYVKKYIYKIDSLTHFDGHLVYVISAINQKNQKEWAKQYISVKNENGEFTEIETSDSILVDNNISDSLVYYITTNKFKILKIIHTSISKDINNQSFIADFISESQKVTLSFKDYNNILYFDYFSRFNKDVHYFNKDIKLKNYTSNFFCELFVNDISKENVSEIPKHDQRKHLVGLHEQELKFDIGFWNNYQYLIDDSLRKKVFEDIEKIDSLNKK